ncbi:MAG: NADH-quinone oxidoreductase subunit NuoK [Deltaproteobacteria bacterium]|nr:NADH-quinone oxidoreductase subunit NuoK [Deltaproteobacteria bacterium]
MLTLDHYLVLSAILFFLGAVGVMVRAQIIVVLMCLELMLNAVNLAFVAFARHLGSVEGQVIVLFVMVVAAAEVAVGLAIAVAIFRQKGAVGIDDLRVMKW